VTLSFGHMAEFVLRFSFVLGRPLSDLDRPRWVWSWLSDQHRPSWCIHYTISKLKGGKTGRWHGAVSGSMLDREKSPVMQSHQPQHQAPCSSPAAAVSTNQRRETVTSAPEMADSMDDVTTELKGSRKTAASAAGRRSFLFKKKSRESSSSDAWRDWIVTSRAAFPCKHVVLCNAFNVNGF